MNKVYNKELDNKIRFSTKYLGVQLFSFFLNFLGWDTVSFAFPFWGIYIFLRLAEKKGKLFSMKARVRDYHGWIGFFIMVLITGFIYFNRSRGLLVTTEYLFAIIFFFCIIDAELNEKELKWLFKMYTYMAIAGVFLMVLQHTYFGSTNRFTVNILGRKKDPNYLSAYFLFPAVYSFYSLCKKNQKAILSCFIIIVGILLTGSRGAFVSLALAIILIILFDLRDYRTLLGLFIIAVILLISFFIFIPKDILVRFIITESLNDGSNTLRLRLWLTGIRIFFDHLLLGAGPNAMITLGLSYGAPVENTIVHNTYIEMLCEYGIIGFIFFIAPIIKIALKSIGQKQVVNISMMAATLCASFIISAQTLQYFWFNMALCASIASHRYFLSTENKL